MNQKTVILSCSSLKDYVEAAQRAVGTAFPVIYLNRVYHRDPQEMREHVLEELGRLPEDVGTVLVSMGFCGGSWEDVEVPCRVVLPRIDDCVSLLLQTTDEPVSDLKEPGHLYVREKDPRRESFHAIFDRLTRDVGEETKRRYHADWMRLYSRIDIMDTGSTTAAARTTARLCRPTPTGWVRRSAMSPAARTCWKSSSPAAGTASSSSSKRVPAQIANRF